MGCNERLYFTVITVLCFGAFILQRNTVSCKDFHRELACYRDRLRITCGEQSFIAIHEAYFTTKVLKDDCGAPSPIEHEAPLQLPSEGAMEAEESTSQAESYQVAECYEDIRVSVNRKCSGAKTCVYSYQEQLDKKCANLRGQFVVQYDCVRNNSVVQYCNTKLEKREGYFTSPGFPQFYPQLNRCGWTVSAFEGQSVLLKVLHLHLRPPTEVFPTIETEAMYVLGIVGQLVAEEDMKCDVDSLTILEGSVKRASVCGEGTSSLKSVEMDTGQAEVSFKSAAFMPASGFLMYYKIEGCPTLSSPDGSSHLVEGNGSLAIFACSKSDMVFNDTLEPERTLSCVRDHHWNDTLLPCVAVPVSTTTVRHSVRPIKGLQLENITKDHYEEMEAEVKQSTVLEDIIIPSVLICVLVIANAIIVATILILRKRRKAKMEEADKKDFDEPDAKAEPLIADINDV